jgi:hypothetical protein
MNSVARTAFSIAFFGLCSVIVIFAILREKRAFRRARAEANVASHESREDRKRKRKELISEGLIVNEWLPDDPPVESTKGDQATQPSGEAVEA